MYCMDPAGPCEGDLFRSGLDAGESVAFLYQVLWHSYPVWTPSCAASIPMHNRGAALLHAQGQPLLAVQPPDDDEGVAGKAHYVLALGDAGTAADAPAATLEIVRQARTSLFLPCTLPLDST